MSREDTAGTRGHEPSFMYDAPSSPRAEVVMRARRSPPRARMAFLRASARALAESAIVEGEDEWVDVEEVEVRRGTGSELAGGTRHERLSLNPVHDG